MRTRGIILGWYHVLFYKRIDEIAMIMLELNPEKYIVIYLRRQFYYYNEK